MEVFLTRETNKMQFNFEFHSFISLIFLKNIRRSLVLLPNKVEGRKETLNGIHMEHDSIRNHIKRKKNKITKRVYNRI